uniref:Uncharacterized protein KIAA0355 n=1 Tax=Phallusia mammillata TaxID=59560 RepID=A0A6F9DF02_9ASCI|nr:uncharacterized protein KIAA0355 [Phallusia mammillata]
MSLGKPSLAYIGPLRQKHQYLQAENKSKQQQQWMFGMSLPLPPLEGNADLHVSYLQQGISAYLDSVQMVCKAGSWIAEAVFLLLEGTECEPTASQMKDKFSAVYKHALDLNTQAKNDFAQLLMNITLPNFNNNNRSQVNKWKNQNAKVLEKCLICLENLHNAVFGETQQNKCSAKERNEAQVNDKCKEIATEVVKLPANQLVLEWNQLTDVKACCSSWKSAKQMTDSLRKSSGLTETEIQNLLKTSSVSDSYIKKLNSKISSGLKNYETTIRALALPLISIKGAFHIAPDEARKYLKNCCNSSEIQQGIERLPVTQFLHCELPLIHFQIFDTQILPDSSNSVENSRVKKKAVSQMVQSTNPKLTLSETEDLTSEILGDICPARWRSHVKATLQLLFGNAGLVVLDTLSSDHKQKHLPTINRKASTIVIVIPSTWCIKEDPGTMIMLHKELDPEKTIMSIQVRYIAVYNTDDLKFEPGIFVEVSLRNAFGKKRNTYTSESFWLEDFSSVDILENKVTVKSVPNLSSLKAAKDQFEEKSDTEEAVQDAIKLLSGSIKIRNTKKFDETKTSSVAVSPEEKQSSLPANLDLSPSKKQEKHADQVDEIKSISNKQTHQQVKVTRSASHNSKSNSLPSTSQSNSSPNSRRSYSQRQSGPKSASFSAFDKNTRMHVPKPVILVRNPQLGNAAALTGSSYLQQNPNPNNTIFLQPGLANFQQQAYQTVVSQCLPADTGVLQRSMYIQSHLQNLRQCQLTRSPSPVTFVRNPHPGVITTASDNLAQTLLKSQSATDLAALQGLKAVQQQQFQQQQLIHQKLVIKGGTTQDFNTTDAHVSSIHGPNVFQPNRIFQAGVERQIVDNKKLPRQNSVLSHAVDRSGSLNSNMIMTDGGQDHLQEVHYSQEVNNGRNRFGDHLANHSMATSFAQSQGILKGSQELHDGGDIINPKIDNLGPIGSPVTARRRGVSSDETKGSNTWPNLKSQIVADYTLPIDESDYVQYVTDIKNALQRKSDDLKDANCFSDSHRVWSQADDQSKQEESSFNLFSTPDLVQHVMPNKSYGGNNNAESASRCSTLESSSWQPWQIWPSEETDNLN